MRLKGVGGLRRISNVPTKAVGKRLGGGETLAFTKKNCWWALRRGAQKLLGRNHPEAHPQAHAFPQRYQEGQGKSEAEGVGVGWVPNPQKAVTAPLASRPAGGGGGEKVEGRPALCAEYVAICCWYPHCIPM